MALCQNDKEKVLSAIMSGTIDAADLRFINLIDEIILIMNRKGLLSLLEDKITDKRADNTNIPLHLLLALAIAPKMKLMTSLTDIPFAIAEAETLALIGWNIKTDDYNKDIGLIAGRNYKKSCQQI